jgi:hypothetical protein
MLLRLGWVGFLCVFAAVAQAAPLRVSTQPPFSAERLGDALRSYIDGAEVKIEPSTNTPNAKDTDAAPVVAGAVEISLRKGQTLGEDAEVVLEVVLIDGEETIIARLPGALRSEDLYRAAALKVQTLLQRRATPTPPVATAATVAPDATAAPKTEKILLDADVAMILPTAGPWHEALYLGMGLQVGKRWRMGLGTYVESQQAVDLQAVHVTSREIPVSLSLGYAWHTGRWQGWLETVGQLAVRRTSADATGMVTDSDTTLSPRLGGTLAAEIAVAPALRACARVSALAVLADARYHVDKQMVWPAADAIVSVALGLQYGGH